MHDFCFTIPYGMLLIVGGFIGYLKKAGFISLKAFEKKKTSSRDSALMTCFYAYKIATAETTYHQKLNDG